MPIFQVPQQKPGLLYINLVQTQFVKLVAQRHADAAQLFHVWLGERETILTRIVKTLSRIAE